MPGNPIIYTSGTAGAVTLTTTAETVVATLQGVTTPFPGQVVKLYGLVLLTTGTSTTAVTMRVRRLTVAGTLVSDQTAQPVTAAVPGPNTYDVYCEDSPGEVASFTYVLTATQTAAAANGASVYANLTARVD